MTILDDLAEHAKERVANSKRHMSLDKVMRQALETPKGNFAFENALKEPDVSFICECKKASPSKGLIAPDFPYLNIAKEYEAAGADCISVLTEPKWFLGQDDYLREIAAAVSIPCIRKDFIVDEYMIYESKNLGASAVLLICAILSEEEIRKSVEICEWRLTRARGLLESITEILKISPLIPTSAVDFVLWFRPTSFSSRKAALKRRQT